MFSKGSNDVKDTVVLIEVRYYTFIFVLIMGFSAFVGKLLIVAAICFQAYLLFQDKKEGDQFNKNLNDALAGCDCLKSIKPLLQQHLRLAVVGLLGFSVLMVLTRAWIIKLFVLTGLSILLWVEHHNVFRRAPTIELLDNFPFWHALGVIGAVLYLLDAECVCGRPAVVAAESEVKPKKTKTK